MIGLPSLRILLVEDNPSDALLLQEALQADSLFQFELTTAQRLADGINLLQERSFDILLADLGLPDSSGLQTFERLHQQAPDLPMIVFSGNEDDEQAVQAVRAGAQDYLVKSLRGFDLAARSIRYAIERNKLQLTLREREAQYRLLFDAIPNAIVYTDLQYHILDWNPAAQKMYGWTDSQAILGKSMQEVVQPQYIRQPLEEVEKTLLAHDHWQDEVIHHRQDGTPVPVLASGTLVRDHLKNGIGYVAINVDITERKQAEEALKESEERFSTAFFTSPISQSIISVEANAVVEVNDACCRLFGYSREELIGTNPGKLNLWVDPAQELSAVEELQRTGHLLPRETNVRVKSGEIRTVIAAIEQISWKGALSLISSIIDITERKQTEQALQKSETRLKGLIESAMDAIITTDEELRIVLFNTAAERMFGVPAREALGQPLNRFIPERFHRSHENHMRQLAWESSLSNSPNRINSIIGVRANGHEFPAESTFSYMQSNGEKFFTAILRDVTERRKAETELRLRGEVMANMAEGVVLVRASDGQIVDANPKFNRMFGYEPGELIGKPISVVNAPTPEKPEDTAAEIIPALQEYGTWSGEVHNIRKNGAMFWCFANVSTLDHPEYGRVWVKVQSDITQRKQAEAALHESQERYQQFISQSFEAISRTEFDGPVDISLPVEEQIDQIYANAYLAECNQAMADMYHVRLDQFIGTRLVDAHGGRDNPVNREAFRKLIRNGYKSINDETIEYDADGNQVWFLSNTVGTVQDGKLVRLWGTAIDITARKKAEAALRESEERYRSLAEASDAIIVLLDAEGRLHYLNEKAVAYQEWQAQDVLGKKLDELLPLQTAEEIFTWVQEVISSGQSMLVEISAAARCYRTSIQPIHNDAGAVVMAMLSATDITALKSAQQELQELNRSLEERVRERTAEVQDLYDNAPTGYHSLEASGRFVQVNQTELTWLGYSREEVLGKPFIDFVDEEGRKLFARSFGRFKDQGWIHNLEFNLIRKDGSLLPVLVNATAINDESGSFFMSRSTVFDNTERRQAEIALRSSQARLNYLLSNTPAMIFTASLKENASITFMSDSVRHVLGYEPENYSGDPDFWFASVHPDDVAFIAIARKELRVKGHVTWETRTRHADGHYIWLSTGIKLVEDENGNPLEVIGYSVNIDERKKAEEALRESQANLQYFFDTASDLIQSMDENGNYLYVNAAWSRTLGYTPEQARHLTMLDVIDASHHGHYRAMLDAMVLDPQPQQLEIIFRSRQGEPVIVEGSLSSRRDRNSHIVTNGIFRNVTERRRIEDALRQSEKTYRALFDNANDLIVIVDTAGRILQINPRCQELLGVAAEDLVGQESMEFILPADSMDSERRGMRLLAGERVPVFERKLIRRDGTIIDVEINLSLIRDEAGQPQYMQSVVRDITVRKRAEEALQQANHEMERALRLRDEFLANTSHELRTPLTGILGLSEALQYEIYGQLNPKQRNIVANIEDNGRHLLELINDILDISKMEAGKLDLEMIPTPLGDICQASLQLVKGMAHVKAQHLEFSMDPAGIVVKGDARRLKQIVVNLLSNAVKYSPEKSRIGLDVRADETTQTVSISVWDQGLGISAENLQKLFQPFVQLDSSLSRQQGGTGLGLALVKMLVDLHGGRIEVQSTPEQGSRFTVILPSLPAGPDHKPPQYEPSSWGQPVPGAAGPQLGTVMLVDDNEMNILMIEDFLHSRDYNIVSARNGADFLSRVADVHPDIILMDVQMPDLDGLEVIRRLRQLPDAGVASIPVIALTALAMPGDRERCLEAGADEYLSKPVRLKELVNLIQKMTANSGALDE